MKKTQSNRKARRPLQLIQRRFIKSRPGSVLILVIALLVLLALIGTAFLSTTQTERYSSQQNLSNTEADLLAQSLATAMQSNIASSLFVNTGTVTQYRPPGQEMPTYLNGTTYTAAPPTTFNNYDSAVSDLFLSDRFPVNSAPLNGITPIPYFNSISWPLFTDVNANYTFDSPFGGDGPTTLYLASNKSQIQSYPTFRTINGQIYPAMLYFIPTQTFAVGTGVILQGYNNNTLIGTAPGGGLFLKQNGSLPYIISPATPENLIQYGGYAAVAQYANFAASAAGDGIADGGMFKLGIGPINNVTYYASMRTIDNNSAVNVSTAWTSSMDPSPTTIDEPLPPYSALAANQNFGFFRSGVGLREMLNPASIVPSPSSPAETDQLNALRFGTNAGLTVPFLFGSPVQDGIASGSARSDFVWSSAGDAIEHQLISRPGNPGYNSLTQKFTWLGENQSAALAYKFGLKNLNASESLIEQSLPNEIYNSNYNAPPTSPFSPAQINTTNGWYNTFFNYPAAITVTPSNTLFNYNSNPPVPTLRPLLTGSNEVSNAVASRLGNSWNTTPVAWTAGTVYNFGDWVTNGGYSYVCILNTKSATGPAAIPGSTFSKFGADPVEYWTRVPWTLQPVKTSINTATFDQLWLGFCQTMTDSILPAAPTGNNTIPQWQPPMMTQAQGSLYIEKQEQMFRSTIRDNRSLPQSNTTNTGNPKTSTVALNSRVQLTPMQQMQLRAALAAINTQTMRNAQPMANASSSTLSAHPGAFGTRSHKITLADTNGNPVYDVEVFGTSIQPYIGQMFAYEPDPTGTGTGVGSKFPHKPFIAIQLLNPYPVPIGVGKGWGFATINRAAYATYSIVAPPITLTPVNGAGGLSTTFVIPAATTTGPGSIVIYDGTVPPTPPPTGATAPVAPFTLPTGNGAVQIVGLTSAIGNELVILKPRLLDRVTGTTATSNPTYEKNGTSDYYQEQSPTTALPNLYDLVPVDQLDMTGLAPVTNDTYYVYKRGSNPSNVAPYSGLATGTNGNGFAWNFVWPGFYTPYNTNNTAGISPTAKKASPERSSLSPIATYPYDQAIIKLSQAPQATYTFSTASLTGGPTVDTTGYSAANLLFPTYNTISLQVNNVGFPGPNPMAASGNKFPFGGFARNLDILQVPYIGAYRICDYNTSLNSYTPTFSMYEMNSVTMDSSLANDSTLQPTATKPVYGSYPEKVIPMTAASTFNGAAIQADTYLDPFVEQIGRFCPVGDPNATTAQAQLDFGPGYNTANTDKNFWHYHWTRRVLGYFSVQTPHDDYLPNVDPAVADANAFPYAGAIPNVVVPPKYTPGANLVFPVNNTQSIPLNSSSYYVNANEQALSEDTTGVEGLININTAPWPVLATLPFVPPGTRNLYLDETTSPPTLYPPLPTTNTPLVPSGRNVTSDNIYIAKAIVYYRNQYGPFKSIFDLYKVPAFRLENEFMLQSDPSNTSTSAPLGDFSGGANSTAVTSNYMSGPDMIRYDFEERFLLLNNISNLVTTHSDSFTCYLLVQGWRNAGTSNPTLAIQRRLAFLVDRNNVTPSNSSKPFYFMMPNE